LSRRTWITLGGLGAVLLVLFLIRPGWAYQWDWAGFGAGRSPIKSPKALFDYYPAKSLWDWMQLLLIPAVLVGAGLLLNSAQQRREQEIAKENRAQDLDIANKNRDQDLDIANKNRAQDLVNAEDRQQEAALGEYLATMTTLLLDKELRKSAEGDEVRGVARVQTLTALRRLGNFRRRAVVEFLYEARLIGYFNSGYGQKPDEEEPAIVYMAEANLRDTNLSGIDLRCANLASAILRGADLTGADLTDTLLYKTDLTGATLTEARMHKANLYDTFLIKADLVGADLYEATLLGVDLTGADLTRAALAWATLAGVGLTGANLTGANLAFATLNKVNLTGATLRGATGMTTEQLESGATSLEGAIMPDGSIHP